MASNAGTGRPLWFRCAMCRRSRVAIRLGRGTNVILTGRTRSAGGNTGIRNSRLAREYRCCDCGHVGWSRHTDLERAAGVVEAEGRP